MTKENKIVQYKDCLVVFDGEIENKDLICRNHSIIAESDAELFAWWVSKGYCFSALKGRFTASYYDGNDLYEFNTRMLSRKVIL